MLDGVTRIVNEPSETIQTYGEAFLTLQFLANAGAVELMPLDSNKTQFKIRKL
jgi:hypothetical protein